MPRLLPLAGAILATAAAIALTAGHGWPVHVVGYAVVCAISLVLVALWRRAVQLRAVQDGWVTPIWELMTARAVTVVAVAVAVAHAWFLAVAWS
jgi:hypothetical protein